MPAAVRVNPRQTRRASSRSTADLDRAALDALADLVLLDPARIDDQIEVVSGNRDLLQEQRIHLDFLGAAAELHDPGNLGHLLAVGKQRSDLGRLLAKLAGVLPYGDRLRAERDAVE